MVHGTKIKTNGGNKMGNKVNVDVNEKFVMEGDKEVCYAKVQTGTHAGKVLRVYYIRPKDGVVCGKDLESKKVLAVGKGSMSPEFRAHFNLTTGRKGQDYSNILAEFGANLEATTEAIEVIEPVQELVEATPAKKAGKPRKSK